MNNTTNNEKTQIQKIEEDFSFIKKKMLRDFATIEHESTMVLQGLMNQKMSQQNVDDWQHLRKIIDKCQENIVVLE